MSTLIETAITLDYDCAPEDAKVYEGIYLDESFYEDWRTVNQYIQEKEKEGYAVLILSPEASQYYLGQKKNHYKYDLILQGNLGYHGEERLVEEMAQIQNPLFLKKEQLIFQESVIVDDFVKENYQKIDTVGQFDVYVQ